MKSLGKITALCAVLLALSGCEGTKEQLGLTRSAPDEFAVLKRAPLEMPPDYTLRPPQPGTPRPQEAEPEKQAKTVIFGDDAQYRNMKADSSEAILLNQAGADTAQPNIRQVVDRETAALSPHEKPVAEKLLGLGSGNDSPPASVVNAKEEAARLKKNAEEGKSVTEGETPTIED